MISVADKLDNSVDPVAVWPRGYNFFFIFNSDEHFNLREQENNILGLSEPEKCLIS